MSRKIEMADGMREANEPKRDLVSAFEGSDTVMLTTRSSAGAIRSRPMVVARIHDDALWFADARSGSAVVDACSDASACVTLQTERKQVTLTGTLEVIDDRETIASLWKDSWKARFPRGKVDPDLVLLRIVLQAGEYWDTHRDTLHDDREPVEHDPKKRKNEDRETRAEENATMDTQTEKNPHDPSKIVDHLNVLYRGELSAEESYNVALRQARFTEPVAAELEALERSHRERALALRERIESAGGKPSESSGAWGTFANTIEKGAAALGPSAALVALSEGEAHGLRSYDEHVKDLDASTKSFVMTSLYPKQQETLSAAERLRTSAP